MLTKRIAISLLVIGEIARMLQVAGQCGARPARRCFQCGSENQSGKELPHSKESLLDHFLATKVPWEFTARRGLKGWED